MPGASPGTSFQATIPLPASPQHLATTLSWAEANNIIYWRNGVADKIYYSGLIYDFPVVQVPEQTVSISDGTVWAVEAGLTGIRVYDGDEWTAVKRKRLIRAVEAAPDGPELAHCATHLVTSFAEERLGSFGVALHTG